MSKRGVFACAVLVFGLAAAAASAAVTAEYFDRSLLVGSDAADPIRVTCGGGRAKVNGVDPEGDPALCGQVESIEVYGGPGPNTIDLAGVASAAFTSVEEVVVAGEDGNDTIAGSQLPDGLEGDLGEDTLRGNAGNDELSGGNGDDRVFGGAGNDTLFAVVGNDSLDGQAGSDTYRLEFFELGSDVRVADTGSEGTDAIDVGDCEGVTVEAGQISREGARVAISGIETYPCGYVPPPAPPAPPPTPTPPPASAKAGCVVPRLRGRSLAKAKVLLVRAHCSLGKVTRVRSRVKRGTVLKQSPAPGLRRTRGTKVSLRVSRGP